MDSLASRRQCLLEDSQDVFLAHDSVLVAVELHLATRVLSEQDLVAGSHLEWDKLAIVSVLALADRDYLTFLGFFLGRVRDNDPALGALLLLDAFDQNPISQWSKLRHGTNCLLGFATSRKSWNRLRLRNCPDGALLFSNFSRRCIQRRFRQVRR